VEETGVHRESHRPPQVNDKLDHIKLYRVNMKTVQCSIYVNQIKNLLFVNAILLSVSVSPQQNEIIKRHMNQHLILIR
jgi:hypothetical protein